ncbi:RrF2 family transcriptional regulator [Marinobacterium sediminicola]|uniref:Transcriptional regulator, BadM/Rrf2 family n=1 Tax=Marinobacterium sediminicola TaxID=518898 RepID=A0ABY1RXI4_9GAMM|nr:Rrf2 family transcriptional regulator [Marinobacterium sediminicola]ULG67730.1 Rrf2 family transcriptional regulator [Marinobacterium sediminicola]SMR71627.1 transcriptional regulator, BadM/Rrf2 family [Marinobacterium sediminicola]
MQLSRFTDYSLRVLFYVTLNSNRLATLSEIAQFYDISLEHLRKVVHALGKSGHLETFRGKNGGIRLALAPESINLGTLILLTEGAAPLVDCLRGPCRLVTSCTLQTVLEEARQAFFDTLSKYTLADLLTHKPLRDELIAVESA